MFSSHATLQFGLETYSSLDGVKLGLASTKFSGGGTNIAAAIDMGVDVLFNSSVVRANAAKIIFLVTDGQSADKANTQLAAERARINGAITFVIGVGKSVDNQELTNIASDPYCLHLFSVHDYNKILDIRSQVARSTCSGNNAVFFGLDSC